MSDEKPETIFGLPVVEVVPYYQALEVALKQIPAGDK